MENTDLKCDSCKKGFYLKDENKCEKNPSSG